MSDAPPRDGSKLGPYLLGRRHPDSDPAVGHIYEATHTQTGAAALVLVPDASAPWAPRAAWTVRSLSEVAPPFLAVEVERAPGADVRALHELTLLHLRMSGALACVEERPDTAAFLARTPRARRRVLPLGLAAVTGAALATALLLLGPWTLAPVGPGDGEAADTVADGPIHWTDLAAPSRSEIAYPLPSAPLKGQQKPPCPEATETINGGCWAELRRDAPCPKGYAEHQGKCYMPVRDPPPEPRSVEP